MSHLNVRTCLANPDMWMRPGVKSDSFECCEHVLLCTDNSLVASDNTESVLRNEIGKFIELKEDSIGWHKTHLGGSVRKTVLEKLVEAWAFSSPHHAKATVNNVESYLHE